MRMVNAAVHRVLNAVGYELYRLPSFENVERVCPVYDRIHYASGRKYIGGWLNVDTHKEGSVDRPRHYMRVNLTERHPFPDGHFRFGFCEDFIEHLDQSDSLTFLVEVYRTLQPGGVLRLSFPSLEGVLANEYHRRDYDGFIEGKFAAYVQWRHRHFYSRESLAQVANHIGFSVKFCRYGESEYNELQQRETRPAQAESNIHAELTKP